MFKTITKPKNKEEIEEIKNVPYPLPEGWKWVRLGEVSNIIMGQSPPSSTYNKEKKGLLFYQGKKEFGEKYLKSSDIYCSEPKKIAIPNDILISVRAPVGDVNIVKIKCSIGRGLAIIRKGENITLEYLFNYLKSIENKWPGKGSTFKGIKKDDLKKLLIPLPFKNGKPDLEKQTQIVERIETIFKEVDKAITLRQKAFEDTKKLFESVLNKIFKEAEEDKDNWKWMKLGEIAEQKKFSIVDGPFGTQLQKKHYKKHGIPLVRILNIKYGLIFDEKNLVYISENDFARLQRSAVYPDDILLAKTGATIGKVCLFPSKYKKGLITSSCAKISVNKQLFSPKFIAYLISSEPIQKDILGISTGATRNSLTLSLIKNLILPIPYKNNQPNLEKQKQIAEYLDDLHNKIKQLEDLQQIQIEKFKELKESILNKAFRGELV